jgi:putative hydrolase of the HAD superfamily
MILFMIQAIAFDFGGTLFSTAKMGTFTSAMTEAFLKGVSCELKCSQENAEHVFEAYIKAWKSRRARGGNLPERELSSLDLLRSALSEVGVKLTKDQMIEILNAFHSEESEQFSPLPHVIESLPILAQREYRLCIVSNNPWSESIRASFRRHKIESFFERIIVSCDVGFRKPHQQIFEELLKQLSLPASEILFVGDSFAHDIEMPKKLGMRTCLVDFEGSNKNDQRARALDADLFLTRFDQLVPAISKLG